MSKLGLYGGWLTVNRACPFRCKWCYAEGTRYRKEDNMPLPLAQELIELMAKIGIENVNIIGGEPTYYPYLAEIAKHIHAVGMTSGLVTNGYRLGRPGYMQQVEEMGIDIINISLKGANPKQHQELTQSSQRSFEMVKQGIRNACASSIPVGVSFVFNSLVKENIDEFAMVAGANGAKDMNIQFCATVFKDGQPQQGYMADPLEIVATLVEKFPLMDKYMPGLAVEQNLPLCLWPKSFTEKWDGRLAHGCHLRRKTGLIFDTQGRVIPCNQMHDYPLGQYGEDFTDPESFTTFWLSDGVVQFYDQIIAYPATACIDCENHRICGGGCPLHWFVWNAEQLIPTRKESVQTVVLPLIKTPNN